MGSAPSLFIMTTPHRIENVGNLSFTGNAVPNILIMNLRVCIYHETRTDSRLVSSPY